MLWACFSAQSPELLVQMHGTMDSIKDQQIRNQNLTASFRNLIMGRIWIFTRTTIQNNHQNKHKNGSLNRNWIFYHGCPCPLTWTLQKMSGVNWREVQTFMNLKDLERFCFKMVSDLFANSSGILGENSELLPWGKDVAIIGYYLYCIFIIFCPLSIVWLICECFDPHAYGVVLVSGLLMSTLWIELPMVAVGLWYGQAYVMDNEHRCILLMAFWMHRDTVTRSWGPLLCHSSTTITSCCSIIMHGPMLQGSVHNSCKLKTSQFLHGQHIHRTCHPLSMFGMLWIGVYDSVFQFLPISSNFTQPLKSNGPTFHRPQSTTWSTLFKGDVLHCERQMVVTSPGVFGPLQ